MLSKLDPQTINCLQETGKQNSTFVYLNEKSVWAIVGKCYRLGSGTLCLTIKCELQKFWKSSSNEKFNQLTLFLHAQIFYSYDFHEVKSF